MSNFRGKKWQNLDDYDRNVSEDFFPLFLWHLQNFPYTSPSTVFDLANLCLYFFWIQGNCWKSCLEYVWETVDWRKILEGKSYHPTNEQYWFSEEKKVMRKKSYWRVKFLFPPLSQCFSTFSEVLTNILIMKKNLSFLMKPLKHNFVI